MRARTFSPEPSPQTNHAFSLEGFAFLPICPAEPYSPGRGLPAQLSEPAGRILRQLHGFRDFAFPLASPTAFRYLASHWPGLAPAGDLLSCFAKKEGKEGDPRRRGPYGAPLLPAAPGGVFANSGLRPSNMRSPYPPVTASTRHDRGGCFNYPRQASSGQGGRFRKPNKQTLLHVSEADHTPSPGGFAFLPICPAEQRSPGRGSPAQLSEPAGRVLRRPPGASSAGQSAKGRPGERGSPSLLSFLATQESKSPAGASPGQRGVGEGKVALKMQ